MISLLGPVLVYRVEERSIDLEPRARGVLAALALHTGQKVAQETLATFVWDVPPNGAASNIRSYVSRIRRILRSGAPYSREWLTTYKGGGTGRGGGYRLDVPKAEIDVFVFTMLLEEGQSALRTGDLRAAEAALAKALTLWRGEAGGPDIAGSNSLLEWLRAHNPLRVGAQEDLTEARLRLGCHNSLIPEIRGVLARDPYRERSWGQLARAFYLAGDLTGALNALTQARETLAHGLGLDPGPELRFIHGAILDRSDAELREVRSA